MKKHTKKIIAIVAAVAIIVSLIVIPSWADSSDFADRMEALVVTGVTRVTAVNSPETLSTALVHIRKAGEAVELGQEAANAANTAEQDAIAKRNAAQPFINDANNKIALADTAVLNYNNGVANYLSSGGVSPTFEALENLYTLADNAVKAATDAINAANTPVGDATTAANTAADVIEDANKAIGFLNGNNGFLAYANGLIPQVDAYFQSGVNAGGGTTIFAPNAAQAQNWSFDRYFANYYNYIRFMAIAYGQADGVSYVGNTTYITEQQVAGANQAQLNTWLNQIENWVDSYVTQYNAAQQAAWDAYLENVRAAIQRGSAGTAQTVNNAHPINTSAEIIRRAGDGTYTPLLTRTSGNANGFYQPFVNELNSYWAKNNINRNDATAIADKGVLSRTSFSGNMSQNFDGFYELRTYNDNGGISLPANSTSNASSNITLTWGDPYYVTNNGPVNPTTVNRGDFRIGARVNANNGQKMVQQVIAIDWTARSGGCNTAVFFLDGIYANNEPITLTFPASMRKTMASNQLAIKRIAYTEDHEIRMREAMQALPPVLGAVSLNANVPGVPEFTPPEFEPIEPPTKAEFGFFSVKKVVTGETALEGYNANTEFTINIQTRVDDNSPYTNYNGKGTDSAGNFTLKANDTKTFGPFLVGTGYKVTELSVPTRYTLVSVTPETGVITQNTEANAPTSKLTTVTNNFTAPKGDLVIEKIFEGLRGNPPADWNATFTVTGPNGFSEEVTYQNFNDKDNNRHNFGKVALGTYNVVESSAAGITGYTTVEVNGSDNAVVTETFSTTSPAQITNEYEEDLGSLLVSKAFTVDGDGDVTTEQIANWSADFLVEREGGGYTTSFSLPENGSYSKVLTDLPIGIYTVRETNSTGFHSDYAPVVVQGGDTATATVVKNEQAEATITNAYETLPGSLTITKSFAPIADVAEPADGWVARFELLYVNNGQEVPARYAVAGLYSDAGALVGEIELSKANNYTWSQGNLPAGSYRIVETFATPIEGGNTNEDGISYGYTWTVGGTLDAELERGGSAAMAATNTAVPGEPTLGGLRIIKTFEVDGTPAELPPIANFTATFTVTNTATGESFDLTYPGNLSKSGIQPGTYTITETYATDTLPAYAFTAPDPQTVVVTEGYESITAVSQPFVNKYQSQPGRITINKSFVGADINPNKSATFEVLDADGNVVDTLTVSQQSPSATTKDLPFGSYRIVEKGSTDVQGYSVDISANQRDVVVDRGLTTTAEFTNTYIELPGSLIIEKVIDINDMEEITEDYNPVFTITNNRNSEIITVNYQDFNDKSGTNWKHRIDNLDAATYTVTETSGTVPGYSWNAAADADDVASVVVVKEVPKDGEATAIVTNTYTERLGTLKIAKSFEGDVTTAPDGWDAEFVVEGPDYSETFTYADFTDGVLTITDLKAGVYTVTEIGGGIDGYDFTTWTTTEDGIIEVSKGNRDGVREATVHNKYGELPGRFVIVKEVNGLNANDEVPALWDPQFVITSDRDEDFLLEISYLNDFIDGVYTSPWVDAATYTITETNGDIAGYTWASAAIGDIGVNVVVSMDNIDNEDKADSEITIVNNYTEQPGSFVIEKDVVIIGTSEPFARGAATATFNVYKADGVTPAVDFDGVLLPTYYFPQNFTYSEDTGTWSLLVDNLREGEYLVVETDGDKADVTNGYTWKLSAEDGLDVTVRKDDRAQDEYREGPDNVKFTNTYTELPGSLYIYKALTSTTGDDPYALGATATFEAFRVTGEEEDEFVGRVYYPENFDLDEDGNRVAVIDNLIEGTYYVVESDATDSVPGYTWTAETKSDNVKVIKGDIGDETSVSFSNNYDQIPGDLIIYKEVVGGFHSNPDEVATASAIFTITDLEGNRVLDFYDREVEDLAYPDSFVNGVATVTNLWAGQYLITETAADSVEGYTWTVSGNGVVDATVVGAEVRKDNKVDANGVVEEQGAATANFTNFYTPIPGSLIIAKVFNGDVTTAPAGWDALFNVTGPNGYDEIFRYIYDFKDGVLILEGLDSGEYTVTETNASDIPGYKFVLESSKNVDTALVSNADLGGQARATIANYYESLPGTISINKTFIVAGREQNNDKVATFDIIDANGNVVDTLTYGGENERLTSIELPHGKYVVKETSHTELPGYYWTVTGDNAEVELARDAHETVSMTNTYTPPSNERGALTIRKVFAGAFNEAPEGFNATFTVQGPNGYYQTIRYADFNEGTSHTIYNLDLGTYFVTESGAEVGNYILTVTTGDPATLMGGATHGTITVTNTYSAPPDNPPDEPEPPVPPIPPIIIPPDELPRGVITFIDELPPEERPVEFDDPTPRGILQFPEVNPSTGIAIGFTGLIAAGAVALLVSKKKKK